VENPDLETLESIGRETGNANYIAECVTGKPRQLPRNSRDSVRIYFQPIIIFRTMTTTLAFNYLPTSQQDGDPDELVER